MATAAAARVEAPPVTAAAPSGETPPAPEPGPSAEPSAPAAEPGEAPQQQPAPAAAPAQAEDAASALSASPVVSGPAGATVSSASPDVDIAQDASPLPGAHRGGFQRLPTAPVAVTVQSGSEDSAGEYTPDGTQWAADDSAFHRGLAGWALAFAVVGLIVSLFVGWGFPVGLVAVVSAIIALRRPLENRAVAVWAIVLGAMSILYSAGWLMYAAQRANLFG
jgi:hypothetical protein